MKTANRWGCNTQVNIKKEIKYKILIIPKLDKTNWIRDA